MSYSHVSEALRIFNSLICFMADATLNIKRKKHGGNSSTSDNDLRSQEEKRARDKPLNIDLASSSGDKSLQHLEMTHDLGTKVDIILPSLEVVNSKDGLISAVVVRLKKKLSKVQGRVEILEQDQVKSKDAITHEGVLYKDISSCPLNSPQKMKRG